MDSYHPDMLALEQQLAQQQRARTLGQAFAASRRSEADARRGNALYDRLQREADGPTNQSGNVYNKTLVA